MVDTLIHIAINTRGVRHITAMVELLTRIIIDIQATQPITTITTQVSMELLIPITIDTLVIRAIIILTIKALAFDPLLLFQRRKRREMRD